MKIMFCNPKNYQGTTHSRKGMYVPLGILSISTVLKDYFGDRIKISVCDEDVEEVDLDSFKEFDLIGFYATTFNYHTCIEYAEIAKDSGNITVLGGPHPTVLAENIMRNRKCFDYIIRSEGETPFLKLVDYLVNQKNDVLRSIPNLVFKENGKAVFNDQSYTNDLKDLLITSRDFVPFDMYVENYRKVYPDRGHLRQGSIYSSKGCSWRDKTNGCVFCARLEEGVRFRSINQVWAEIDLLRSRYKVNSIWDISDDNLGNRDWFKKFVESRPIECKDLVFFIYSRINFVKPDIIKYLKELNVEEVFLGVESGDNRVLKQSFKGQTAGTVLRAVKLLRENDIKYFPSFILGLPEESEESMTNTYNLCKQIADIGGLDRLGCTILQPIPGSPSYDSLLRDPEIGAELSRSDDIDLTYLERYWVEKFTDTNYDAVVGYREKINELMKDYMVFGDTNNEKT